jgi:hypothetical protein
LRALGIRSLSLFGSVAREQAAPGSDVDLLVEIDWSVGFFHLFEVQRILLREASVKGSHPFAAAPLSSSPSARMTFITVPNSGFPLGESALQRPSRVRPVLRASCDIPRALAMLPSAVVVKVGSSRPSSRQASR